MSSQALYRKNRPRSLQEVVGQEHITQTLGQAIKNGRISHAYLFTGPRGTGKTSVARILAHEVNQLPYSDDSLHLDIIEIDAASNRRIDEIRDLREKVHIAPTSAHYKVYIIDEAHMLTREAFNALLKTLEEPPEHCIFILATTESHKLPPTIVSRTQRFNFKPVPLKEVRNHLQKIAKDEKIDIDSQALELLASHGGGSFRDSISLLDQLGGSDTKVDAKAVLTLTGVPPAEQITDLLQLMEEGSAAAVLDKLEELIDQGFEAVAIAKELAQQIRQLILSGDTGLNKLELLKQLLDIPTSHQPRDLLEIVLLNYNSQKPKTAPVDGGAEIEAQTPAVSTEPEPKAEPAFEEIQPQPEDVQMVEQVVGSPLEQWPAILADIKQEAPSLYSALRLAVPELRGSTLNLAFQFPLHQKKVDQLSAKQLVAKVVKRRTGKEVNIECFVDKSVHEVIPPLEPAMDPLPNNLAETTANADPLATISNIFGGGEVLES